MRLREAMEGDGAGRKKLKHRLAAILSAFSRRVGGGRKRSKNEEEATPPLAFPSYSRLGGGKKPGGMLDRRLSVSAPRSAPLLHITIDCAGRRSVDAADPSILPLDVDAASRKTERRLTENGLPYEASESEGRKCPPSSPFVAHLPPLPPVARWKERANNSSRRLSTHSSRRLVSSSSSDDEHDEDSRNLFSSRSFSSDSSEFYNCPRKNTRARASVSGPCRAPPTSARRGASQSCRYSFELPRGSTASAATDGGFAVVKRSADPYEDFRKSMQEMIAEWPAGGDGDGSEGDHSAERLLETYLVLNSPRHYPAILAAFADVRETLFP
ncbi:transcription repressor OFP8-like [Phragmites australis]|uniref:transcription repressor OFP8-like n=1 Tax=Phragmites australis TaxID=29695 RepID=UPI002D7A125D|nr:transcription repressor OFP8-like [Phragmites australis]